MNNA
ncbi:hypothetical protein D041_0318A, partial [Vibrio parahaemolyticus EKP-008]|jgi:hypothetical protein